MIADSAMHTSVRMPAGKAVSVSTEQCNRPKFAASFAAHVETELVTFMGRFADPWGMEVLNGAVTTTSWNSKPSWYVVATDDAIIPSDALVRSLNGQDHDSANDA